jgi:uncharacterized protein
VTPGGGSVTGVSVERDVAVPMRDGTVLRADVHRPEDASGRLPVLLMRVPYGKRIAQSFGYRPPQWYARRGYIVAIQDVRGRFASDGVFRPFEDEVTDGVDTLDWAASLPGGTGRVGMYGFSYAGYTQLAAATGGHPALACIAPAFASHEIRDAWIQEGGALNLAFVVSWTTRMLALGDAVRSGHHEHARRLAAALTDIQRQYRYRPLRDLAVLREVGRTPYFFDWLEHEGPGEFWTALDGLVDLDRIVVPCLHVGGWFDIFSRSTVSAYRRLASAQHAAEQRIVMGGWVHVPWDEGAAGLPPASESVVVDEVQLSWFDRHLKGSPAGPEAPIRLYRMGTGKWESLSAWPEVAEDVLWLASGGAAMSRRGDGVLSRELAQGPPDHLVSDPHTPVFSQGGNSCCIGGLAPMGQADQATTEMRNDVLVYTSAPLAEPLGILGSPVLELFVASSGPSDDWVVRLTDVDERGRSVNVSQGIQRVWNEGPEQVLALRLELRPTSWMFASGHRIRLQITGSDYPAHDVNAHADRPTGAVGEAGVQVSTPTVLHQGRWPSRLVLPRG